MCLASQYKCGQIPSVFRLDHVTNSDFFIFRQAARSSKKIQFVVQNFHLNCLRGANKAGISIAIQLPGDACKRELFALARREITSKPSFRRTRAQIKVQKIACSYVTLKIEKCCNDRECIVRIFSTYCSPRNIKRPSNE